MLTRHLCAALLVVGGLGACGEDEKPSGAVCPTGSTLTYDNFGRAFMEQYCTRCHSSTLSGAQRSGAPSDHNFDTLDAIREAAEHVNETAAAGPGGVNEQMPPGSPAPTAAERRLLGEWIARGMP